MGYINVEFVSAILDFSAKDANVTTRQRIPIEVFKVADVSIRQSSAQEEENVSVVNVNVYNLLVRVW